MKIKRDEYLKELIDSQWDGQIKVITGRAVLRLQCGIDAAGARRRLKRLADRGVEEARLFLGNLKGK